MLQRVERGGDARFRGGGRLGECRGAAEGKAFAARGVEIGLAEDGFGRTGRAVGRVRLVERDIEQEFPRLAHPLRPQYTSSSSPLPSEMTISPRAARSLATATR